MLNLIRTETASRMMVIYCSFRFSIIIKNPLMVLQKYNNFSCKLTCVYLFDEWNSIVVCLTWLFVAKSERWWSHYGCINDLIITLGHKILNNSFGLYGHITDALQIGSWLWWRQFSVHQAIVDRVDLPSEDCGLNHSITLHSRGFQDKDIEFVLIIFYYELTAITSQVGERNLPSQLPFVSGPLDHAW